MNAYIAYIKSNLRLTMRDRSVLFFNYIFPLIFFFMFGQLSKADRSAGAATEVVNMVLTIGILGAGFFGAGMRAVMDREQNILRRFKVAPITPGPILAASLVSGLIHYAPVAIGITTLAHFRYGMPWPERWISLTIFVAAGVIAFRAMGMIIAAVSNSMAESNIVIQILYFPMLMLSGATIPLSVMPEWLQTFTQFLPSTHLFAGLQMILIRKESLLDNAAPLGSLLLASLVGTVIVMKLFRWEKEEKVPASAKIWIAGILLPFAGLGIWQAYTKDNINKNHMLDRQVRRDRARLIRDARVIVGDGTVIDRASVLIKNGKIMEIYPDQSPDADKLKADLIEAAGKTLMPGLIDVHVHLGAPGGYIDYEKINVKEMQANPGKPILRRLAAYLYSGVTAVKSNGDTLGLISEVHDKIESGAKEGSELFFVGPMFTAAGGHGTEYFKYFPADMRAKAEQEMVRLPKTSAEARQQVEELKRLHVHGIKAILESGMPGHPFNRLDTGIYKAIAEAAHAQGLPLATHTGDLRDMQDAIDAGTSSIEHGAMREEIPEAMFAQMKAKGIAYSPTMAVYDGIVMISQGKLDPFERTLVQQVGPPDLLKSTKEWILGGKAGEFKAAAAGIAAGFELAKKNLLRAHHAGVTLVTGSDAGNYGVVHGPTVHREVQIWVQAGVPAAAALRAATFNSAQLLGASNRMGLVKKGYEATLLLVDGNPLQEIGATERISMGGVFLKGERVDRSGLFDEDKQK